MSKQEIVMSAFVMNAVKALEAAIVQEYNNQNTPLSSKLAGSLEGIYRHNSSVTPTPLKK